MTTRPESTAASARSRLGLAAVLCAAVVALALVLGPGGSPAGAHDGDAVIDIEAVHPAGDLALHYIVRVTWENDGHPAADATVTATAVNADGTQLTPVALAPADSDGRYAGVLQYPAAGAWKVRVTSVRPTGTREEAQQVAPPPTTAADAGNTDETSEDGGGFAPADDGTGASDEGTSTEAAAGSDDDSGSGMPVLLIVAAGAVAVIGFVTALNIIRRKGIVPPATPAGPGATGTSGDGGGDSGAESGNGETTPSDESSAAGTDDRSSSGASTTP
jgi:hypothetical protein